MRLHSSYLYLVLLVTMLICSIVTPISLFSQDTSAGVKVIVGPTPIMEGEAKGPNDVTLMNEYLAVAFGISTTPPWGIPPGHIIDIAVIGEKTSDVVAQFSFPLNDWGNWASIKEFDIVENTPQRAVIQAIGTWKGLQVNYTYILESGKPYLKVVVNVTNTDTSTYSNLIMGPAITFERGWTFVPGYGTGRISTSPKINSGIVEDWVAGYHEDYAIGLYAPNYTHISLSTYFVDTFYQVTLNPGESRVFETYIVALSEPDTCRVMEIIYQIKGGELAYVYGTARDIKGNALENAAVIAYRDSKPYCWSITNKNGEYSMSISAPGTYSIRAIAKAYGPSSWFNITLAPGSRVKIDFSDVVPPGTLVVNVFRNDTNKPTDARLLISGGFVPPVQYMAVTTAYTDLFEVGKAVVNLAPGTYNITVDYGAGFISLPVTKQVSIESEKIVELNITVEVLFKPQEYGWYMVDLHHHSDYMDGKTPPNLLVVSQLASALDFIFVSDHDYIGNCPTIENYAKARNTPFICGVEISPDWAHFNVYPVLYPEKLVYRGTLREIITSARNAGAIVVRANHPYIGGLFIAQESNNIPGGYYEDWDTAEINGPWSSDDARTLSKMFTLWDTGIRKYLTAGSDVHDVIAQTYTGKPRVVAYLPMGPDPISLAYAEKYGKTFITYGPFIFTEPLPGSTLFAKDLNETINIKIKFFSVNGLDKLEVYVKTGWLFKSISLNRTRSGELELQIPVVHATNNTMNGYIVIIAYDSAGNRAINNPIWVDLAGVPYTLTLPITTTVVQTVQQTTTISLTQTQLQTITQTETSTLTRTTTITETATTATTSILTYTTTNTIESIRYDLVAILGIISLIIGLGIGYIIKKK
ncbi:MAG: CehA/McbA family metallohydrolase [Desulfurococcaceae archaeon]